MPDLSSVLSIKNVVASIMYQVYRSLLCTIKMIIHPVLALKDYPVLFRAGHYIIVTTGVINSLAAVLSYVCALSLYQYIFPNADLGKDFAWKLAMVSVFSLVFSKLFHYFALGKLFFMNPKRYLAETAFYNQGGQFGVLFGTIWFAWVTDISFFACMDINLTAGCLALSLGRVGCYSYGCCHGRPTNSRFGIAYDHPETKVLRLFPELKGVPLVPTQLISALFTLALFSGAIISFSYFSPRAGMVSTFLIFAYSSFRILIERHRLDVVDVQSKENRNEFYIRVARFIMGIGVTYALVLLWMRTPQIFLSASSWPGSFPGLFLMTPGYAEGSLTLFLIYLLVWGIHYKNLGQHFQWKRF